MSPTDYEAALLKNKSAQKRKYRKEDQNNGRMRATEIQRFSLQHFILFYFFALLDTQWEATQ